MRLWQQINLMILFISVCSGQVTVGLVLNGPDASPGYSLFAPAFSESTYLIDNDGLLIHEWKNSSQPYYTAYLLEDGSLLRAARLRSKSGRMEGGFQKYSWDGELIWTFSHEGQHHDIEPLPNGNVLMVTHSLMDSIAAIAAGRDLDLLDELGTKALSILEVRQTGPESGEIVWEWHVWDHLVQDYDSLRSNYGDVSLHPELVDINYGAGEQWSWLHTNSIDYNEMLDQIMVSNRSTNDIWIIDHSTSTLEAGSHAGGDSGMGGDLLYRWGNPQSYRAGSAGQRQLFWQHDAHWIEPGLPGAGNILIFNNGVGDTLNENNSSIVEIVPPLESSGLYNFLPSTTMYAPESPVWKYFSDSTFIFQSGIMGGVQRLPNGNTLVCSSEDGKFFEVTPSGSLAWVYINPVSKNGILSQGEDPAFNLVARCLRYPLDYPGFLGKDLTPGDPIELYPNHLETQSSQTEGIFLLNHYPNPFNSSTTVKYQLSDPSRISIKVINIMGQEIAHIQEKTQSAGQYQVQLNLSEFNSGVYFYKLEAKSISGTTFSETKRMLLIK